MCVCVRTDLGQSNCMLQETNRRKLTERCSSLKTKGKAGGPFSRQLCCPSWGLTSEVDSGVRLRVVFVLALNDTTVYFDLFKLKP